MRRALLALSLLIAVAAAPAARADTWTARGVEYPKTFVERDVLIPISDGVALTADVIHPADADGVTVPGRFPVLLTQTPYNKNALNFLSNYMVQRGYVQVIAEVRGTGSSEGIWDSFGAREQADSCEIAQWAATQSWSDGRIGLHGTSYGAINQLFTASCQNPAVKAAFPIVPMADAYRDITASGGQINTSFIPSWLGLVTALGLVPATYTPNDPARAATVLGQHVGGALAFQAATVARATAGEANAFDGPFYRTRSPIEIIDRVQIPTFVVGGFFDLFQRGEPMLFQRLQRNGVPTRLLMGPWYHVSPSVNSGLPADGIATLDQLELRWLDHYVRGVPDDALDDDIAPVNYFRIGEGHYHRASTWPPPGAAFTQRYLSGPAIAGVQAGSLATSPPASQEPDSMAWQPASGPCSRSTAQWTAAGVNQGCEADQRTNDVGGLTYDLPVGGGLTIAGPIAAQLFVSSSGADAFITARVEDVAADGKATGLTAGWNVLSLRALDETKTVSVDGTIVQPYHPFTKESVLDVKADTIYELWVEIFPTSAMFAAGHTLRLALQPSDAPHLSAPVPQTANLAGGVLRVHHDAAHPSGVVLPFLN